MALSIKNLLRQNEFWVFLFVLGLVLLNWPMLTLAVKSTVWGMPAILVYVASVWLLIILLLYLFDRGSSD
jgi:NADH:ubiquinone oxidoreductase subunit 6 (subunit J)